MTIDEVIAKKRDGLALSKQEISQAVCGYSRGLVPDSQMAALLMGFLLPPTAQ